MSNLIWDFNSRQFVDKNEYFTQRQIEDQEISKKQQELELASQYTPAEAARRRSAQQIVNAPTDRIAPRSMPDNNLLKGIGSAVDKLENSKLWRTVIGNPDEGFGVGDMTNALLMANPTATAGAGIATLGKAAKATPAAAKAGQAINKGAGLLKGIVAKTPTPIKAGIGGGAAVTGAETIAGAVDPDYVNPISGQQTFPSKFGSSLRAGTGDTVGLVGSVAEWQGYDELGKSLKNKGKKISEGFEPNRTEFKGWQSFLDPEWYANNVAATLPTTASLIPLMIVGYKLGGKAGTKALTSKAGQKMVAKKFGQEMVEEGTERITPFVKTIFGSLGGTALSRPLESALEAGGTYEDALARGMSEEQAVAAADRVYSDNLKLAGMDVAQLALTFAPTGKIASKMGKALTATGKVVGDVATESLEEGLQQGIQQRATGADTRGLIAQMWNPTAEMKEAMAIGGLLGGGMGAVGAVRDMVTTIKQRTIAELPDDVMPTIQQRLQQITDMGVDPVKAIDQVLDEVSDSPGVKATVERITQEEAASTIEKLSSSVSGQEPGQAAPINEGTQPAAPSDNNEAAIDVVYTSDGTPLRIIDQSSPAVYVVQDQEGNRDVVSRDDVSEPAQIPQKDFASPKTAKVENNTAQNQAESGDIEPVKPVNPPKDQNGLGGQSGTNAANVTGNGALEPVDAGSNVGNDIKSDVNPPKPTKEPWQMTKGEYAKAQFAQDAEESTMVDYIEDRTNEGASIQNIAKELGVASSKVQDLYNSYIGDEVADIDEKASPEEQHRSEVERAISEGKPVPEEVLKDYPALVKKQEPAKPTPDRKLKIQRGKHGAVDVVFPDSVHADLFSFNGRLQRQIKGEKKYFDVAHEIKRLALSLGLPEDALNKGDIAGQYKAAVMKLISGLPAGTTYEAPRLSDLPDIVTEKEPEKDPDTPPKQPVDMDALKAYAEGVVKSGEVEAVYLIGSTAAKGSGNDIDILYQLKDRKLPESEEDATEKLESIVESLDMELDLYDTFIQVGERYFHLSSGAGRGFVENNDYANENKDKPKVLLARAEKAESHNQHIEETPEEPEKEPTVKEVGEFTITKTKHTKTGADMWVVRLKDDKQLPTDEFKKLAARIKALGGSRWSKFSKGFNFYEDPTEKLQPKTEVKKGDKVYDKDGNELTVVNPGNENTMRVRDKDGNQQVIKKDDVKGERPETIEILDSRFKKGSEVYDQGGNKFIVVNPGTNRDNIIRVKNADGKFSVVKKSEVKIGKSEAKKNAWGDQEIEVNGNVVTAPGYTNAIELIQSGGGWKTSYISTIPSDQGKGIKITSSVKPTREAAIENAKIILWEIISAGHGTPIKAEKPGPTVPIENAFEQNRMPKAPFRLEQNEQGGWAVYDANDIGWLSSINKEDAQKRIDELNKEYGGEAKAEEPRRTITRDTLIDELINDVVNDNAVKNAVANSDKENALIEIEARVKKHVQQIFDKYFDQVKNTNIVDVLKSFTSLAHKSPGQTALIKDIYEQLAKKTKPAEPVKNKDRSREWLDKMEKEAQDRINSRKGRLLAGLPMDDMLDYSIIGMVKIARTGLDLAAFTKEMIDEYGPQLKNWMAGIYAQSQAMLEMTEEDLNQMIEDARRDSTSNNEAEGVNLNQENAEAKEGEQDAKPDKSVLEPRDEEGTAGGRLPTGADVDSLLGTGGQDSGVSGQDVGSVAGQAPVQQGQSGGSDTSANIPTTDRTSPDGQEPAGTSDGADDSQVGQPGGDGKSVKGDTTGSTTIPGEPEGSTDKAAAEGDQVIDNPLQTLEDAFGNFHINEENPVFVKGGKKVRFRANIAALKTLDLVLSEKREATQEEKRKLALFSGWGALMEAFTFEMSMGRRVPKYPAWEQEYAEVKDLLNELESKHFGSEYNYRGGLYDNAAGSVMNAHYTSPAVIGGMYQALEQMGYKKGNLLEPSMGTGNFFGMLPLNFAARTKLFGVELDPVTGKIAQLLYPNADIRIQGFQDAVYPKNFFDVAVGNVPFGNYHIADRAYPNFVTERIHNYFFAKTVDKVRPGGVVAFITSSGTMDAEGNERVRQYLAQKANLLGAIRLPGDAFKENAGTEVTTDIIFLQKLKDGELPGDIQWTGTVKKEIDEETYSLNQYYNDHPDMVLGEFVKDKLTGGRLGVKSTGQDIEEAIAQAIEKLPKNVISNRGAKQTLEMTPENALLAAEILDGGITLKDSKLYRKIGDSLVQITENVAQIKQLVQIRELAKEVLVMQRDPEVAESDLEAKRAEMKKLYDTYVKKYGNFLKTEVRNGRLWGRPHIEKILGYAREIGSKDKKGKVKTEFTTEPETYLLKSLEIELLTTDDEGNIKQEFKPSQIMTQRTYKVVSPVDKVDNAQDGLVASLNQFGYVDMDHIVEIYGKSEEEIAAELGDKIYKNPLSGWETADEYLSGNVKKKLREAQERADYEPEYSRNVEALSKVIPKDVPFADITVNLGDGWVPFHITEAAVKNLLGFTGYRSDSSIKLEYSPLDNKWNLSKGTNYRNTAEMAVITAGVPKDPLAIVKIALNNTETIIKTTVDGKTFVNQEATNALKAKVKEIRQYLKEYLSADLDAMNEVEEIYNDKFNATVPRDYSKIAEYFTFPNMNPDVELRPHQKNAIVRALMGGNSLLAHGVGAGKTFEQIGIAMEAKRLGLANKPLLVVPNTKLTDFESAAKLLYPGAKVLALSQDDFEGNSIKRTLALAAVNDWDMVIVRHSSFSKIPVSPETELPALQAEIQGLEAMLEEMTGERGFTVKKLQARLEKLRAKLHDYQENRVQYEGLLNFEDMGFDMLIVDEAHEYKNYPLTGKASSIKGLASGDADKARDMMIKSGYIRKLNGGNRGVVFGTGTPISNSMAEVFVMFKYLRPDLLREAGISHFDAWADAFSNITEVAEVSAKGEFRNKMQFKSFVNLPELITLFREFTDIKMQDTLNLPLPKHEIVKVECEAHPQLAEVMAQVEEQWADAIKSRQLFRLINIVLNAPQDIRLVIAGAINHSGSKVNKIANNVKEVYDKTAKEKGTQLIFATTGESSLTGFSLWTELETQLIKKGIPANEIAFIKTGTKEEELEEIYRKINAGKIRVAIGSYSKMGVGINVQERLFAIHELNAPYRPADIEQAEGRMIRQGNLYYKRQRKSILFPHIFPNIDTVKVYRYVTVGEEGAFSGDAFKWQILENKVKSINAVMKGDPSVRVLDAFDEDSYDAATMKAIAIGDERYMRKVELEGEIDVLRSSYNAYKTGLARAQRELTKSRKKIRSNRDNIHNLQRALKTIEEMPPSVIEKQIVTIGGEKYTLTDKDSKKAADEAIKRYIAEYEAKPKNDSGRKQLANIQGMTLMYEQKYNNGFGSMIQGFALFADYYTNLMKVESRYVKLDKNNSSKDFLSLDKDNIFDAIFRKIKSFQREIDKMLKENDVLDKEVEKYEQILKQPFKHQEELDEKRAELREIDAALNIGTVAASGEAGSMDGGDAPATNTRQRRSGPRLKESTQTTEGAEAPIFYDPNEMLDELSGKLGRKMYAAPEAMEREDMQAAGIIANLLTQSQLIPMKGQDAPQGAAYGNNVFVSVETEDPHLYVAMHEIEHTLEDVDPEAHDEFMAIAKKYFNGAVGMSDYYFRHGYSYKDIWKEFTADVTAEIMQQPGFWAKVREQSPALIKKIVDIIDQIITKFRKEVAKDSSMLQYISDIEAFRDEVAGATAKLLKKKPRNLLDLRGAEAFAAKAKEKSEIGRMEKPQTDIINPTGQTNRLGEEMKSLTKQEIDTAVDAFYDEGAIVAVGARYGESPETGRSYNYATNSYENGVSMMQVNDLPGVNSFAVADAKDNRELHYYKGKVVKTTGGDNELLMTDLEPITRVQYDEFTNSQQGKLSSLVLAFWRSDVMGRIGSSRTYPELWQRWEDAYNDKLTQLTQTRSGTAGPGEKKIRTNQEKLSEKQHLGTEFEGKSIGTLADFVTVNKKAKSNLLAGIGTAEAGKKPAIKLETRYKPFGVGKSIGGRVYMHRQYENLLQDKGLEAAKAKLPDDFNYVGVTWDTNTGDITFTESPDFYTSDEPIVGDQFTVKADGTTRTRKANMSNPQIWHHKWLWVKDDFTGFDVEASKERSRQWLSISNVDKSRIGYKAFWDQNVVPLIKSAPRLKVAAGQVMSQAISSANTSLSQVASTFKSKWFKPGKLNIDIGGGRYDKGSDYLQEAYGTENLIFDPFNRDEMYNRRIIKRLQSGERGDTVTVNNVLNVIAEKDVRLNVVKQAAKAVSPGGEVYFQIYEGNGSGQGKETSKGFQMNLKAQGYIEEVQTHFERVERHGSLIVATGPKNIEGPAIWELGNNKRISFKHSKGSGFNLPNKHREVQDRMEGARGVPAETLRERMREIWDEVVRKSTREFEHLPHGRTYAELRNSLLLLRKQKGIAADKTLKVLNDITKPLNEYEYDVFSYKVIFDDLAHEFEENHLLPFGLTEENFEDIKDYIDEEAAKLPKVQEAIEKRRGAWNKAKNDYIQAQKAVGFNVEDRLKKEDYFRHQVLEYANGKGVMGSGKRLRVQTGRGFLRKRGGSTYDINTDYLQAEFEVMAQMIVDTASAGTVKVVKENHDIVKELKREAVRINDQGMLQEFQRLLDIMQDTETTPEQLYRRTLNRKQAIAYSQLYKLAAMGELPNGGGKWDQIIEVMSNAYWDAKEANANDESGEGGIYSARIPDEYQGQLMAYLNYLASQDESEVGKIKARTVFKGMAQKVKTIQKTLGARYVTWEDLVPDGYTLWQPREGHMFFMANSIPQGMAEQLLYGIANEINIDATMLKKVMVAGQKYPELVIPDEVALTLETLYKDANQVGPVAKWLFHTPYRAWKQWQLISPRRYFKYNVRNTTGDLDAVLAGNPSALRPKILKKAWDDLKQGFFSKDREYTRSLQGWFERGGFETLMQAQEINDINRNRQFRHLMESRMQKDLWEKAQASPKTLWNGYWDTVRATTDFREALMRYACYLDYLEQMQANHGIPKNFGASNREEVMALPDIRDRAAKLSNELLGAYDEVSVVGTWLADHLFPFWRWNEVNFVRYMRLGRNAWQDGQLCATTARKFTGLAIRSPLIAAKIGKFVLQATALTVMINLWNWLFFDDEDKELPDDVRNRLHITFGRDSNGNILYFSRLGALQDFLDWFGIDTPVKTAQDFLSGRKSLLEIATDWGKADVNKVLNAITPFVKTPVELITDTKFYPDVFEAMPIRDRWQYLFDSFGLGNEYKAMAGKPTRGYGNSLYDLFYYRADPYETAYYKNKENVIKFRKKIGTYNEGYSESARSDALYNIKLAMRYGDKEAAEKYLLDYINKGGTAKGLSTSLKSLSPVYGLNETQTEVYIQNYLDVEGKENLAKAIDYYQRVIGGEMFEQD